MGKNQSANQKVATLSSYLPTLSESTHTRHDLRQEPSAVNPLARIREGGSLQRLSLPRHSDGPIELHPVEFGNTVICTLDSPQVLLPKLRKKVSGLRGELRVNPVFRIGRKTPAVELSMLNAGTMFDIELPVAWEKLTGQVTESDTLWVYILS